MKFKKTKKYIPIFLFAIIFYGCGGGGGGGGSSSSSSSVSSGSFIDSAVEGLTYSTPTQSGKTDNIGRFYYTNGETVSFYIGNIFIGSAIGGSQITPLEIVSSGDINNAKVLNIARVLQTFDSDKNPATGITLVDAAKNLDFVNGDFNNSTFITNLINEVNSSVGNLVEVNTTSAREHLMDTLGLNATNGNDPLISNQWYLDDLNITEVHKDYNGSSANGSIIQIVDTGIEHNHEDIIVNLDLSKSYNAETVTSLNCAPDSGESHGTQCAGIASARGYNNKGIRGINPLGKVVGFKFKTDSSGNFSYNQAELEKAWTTGDGANDITVSSNSWGSCFDNGQTEEDILAIGASILRDGKGRIYVMAGGNDREDSGNCPKGSANLTYTSNSQYMITVAALNKNNTFASYSSQGSNILISAYGVDVYSTDLSNSYSTFGGTSAATPMVAGGIGLILEACPNLTYRDVKYILAKTATHIDSGNSTWVTNNAGLKHSIDYGYGRLNVSGAITMCKSGYTNLGAKFTINDEITGSWVVPNDNSTGITKTINVTENKTVEWVGVTFMGTFDNLGEFEFYLTSPSGTITKLLHNDNGAGDLNINNSTFRLSSTAFIDENSIGDWSIKIADRDANTQTSANRTITKIELQIVGH